MTKSPTLPKAISADGLPIPLSREHLKLIATWIRDDLDPIIAREGPEILHPDDVLTLHELFVRLGDPNNELNTNLLRYSRIHCAVLEVAGKATRWPGRLADECDELLEMWRDRFGHIELLRPYLFGSGGRLTGICGTGDLTRAGLVKLWQLSCPERIARSVVHKHGNLGFTPGDWWINGLFACHAGIIDLSSTDGGICFDSNGAYAVVLKDTDEIDALSPDAFTYRTRPGDRGRYRLSSADFKSRFPVRILRSHSLASLWAPRVGIRYEGLHRVTGWTVKPCNPTPENSNESTIWEVKFQRERETVPMEVVLRHPYTDEIEDYMEWKRLRRKRRDKHTSGDQIGILGQGAAASLSGENLARRAPRKPVSVIAAGRRHQQSPSVEDITEELPEQVLSGPATQKRGERLPSMRFMAPTPPSKITLSPVRSAATVVPTIPTSTSALSQASSQQSYPLSVSSQSTLMPTAQPSTAGSNIKGSIFHGRSQREARQFAKRKKSDGKSGFLAKLLDGMNDTQ